MRLGQVHRAAPFSRNHVRCIFGLQFIATFYQNGGHGAVSKAGIHRKSHVRTRHILLERHRDDVRHPLPAKFFRSRQRAPTSGAILVVSVLKTLWRGHAAIVMPGAALKVADLIERKQHALNKL